MDYGLIFSNIFKKFYSSKGRAGRVEMILSIIMQIIISLILFLLIYAISSDPRIFFAFFPFTFLVPTIFVVIRRLHDINKSGLFFPLSILFPPLFWLYIIALFFIPGNKETNKFGDPENY